MRYFQLPMTRKVESTDGRTDGWGLQYWPISENAVTIQPEGFRLIRPLQLISRQARGMRNQLISAFALRHRPVLQRLNV